MILEHFVKQPVLPDDQRPFPVVSRDASVWQIAANIELLGDDAGWVFLPVVGMGALFSTPRTSGDRVGCGRDVHVDSVCFLLGLTDGCAGFNPYMQFHRRLPIIVGGATTGLLMGLLKGFQRSAGAHSGSRLCRETCCSHGTQSDLQGCARTASLPRSMPRDPHACGAFGMPGALPISRLVSQIFPTTVLLSHSDSPTRVGAVDCWVLLLARPSLSPCRNAHVFAV